MKKIDLNADLGENFGNYQCFDDRAIMPFISSANIACAYHAGDAITMLKTVKVAKEHNIAIGAHPALPDLVGFGRRRMAISDSEAYAYTLHQLGALKAFCLAENVELSHVKSHGALYNMAAEDYDLATSIAQAVYDFDNNIFFYALSGSQAIKAAKDIGLQTVSEVFADRAYQDNGRLVARSQIGAVLKNEAVVEQALSLALEGKVRTISGKIIDLAVDSICLHGDSAEAIANARAINSALHSHNIQITRVGN